MATTNISIADLMASAIARRDELNVFIRLLTNLLQGRDLTTDYSIGKIGEADGEPISGDSDS